MSKEKNQINYIEQYVDKDELAEMLRVNYAIANHLSKTEIQGFYEFDGSKFANMKKNIEELAQKHEIPHELFDASDIEQSTIAELTKISGNFEKINQENVDKIYDELQMFNEDFDKNQNVTTNRALRFSSNILKSLGAIPFSFDLCCTIIKTSLKIANSFIRNLEKNYANQVDEETAKYSEVTGKHHEYTQLITEAHKDIDFINKYMKDENPFIKAQNSSPIEQEIIPSISKNKLASHEKEMEQIKKDLQNIGEKLTKLEEKAHKYKTSTILQKGKEDIIDSAKRNFGSKKKDELSKVRVGSHIDRVNDNRKNAKPKTPGVS